MDGNLKHIDGRLPRCEDGRIYLQNRLHPQCKAAMRPDVLLNDASYDVLALDVYYHSKYHHIFFISYFPLKNQPLNSRKALALDTFTSKLRT